MSVFKSQGRWSLVGLLYLLAYFLSVCLCYPLANLKRPEMWYILSTRPHLKEPIVSKSCRLMAIPTYFLDCLVSPSVMKKLNLTKIWEFIFWILSLAILTVVKVRYLTTRNSWQLSAPCSFGVGVWELFVTTRLCIHIFEV